jgi:hypothetical protein
MVLQCIRYTVRNHFFTANASVEGQKSTRRSNALLQCIHYVVDTQFLSLCQTQMLRCHDTGGTKITSGDECHNSTLLCDSVNEVNKECILESEKGEANERHVVDAASN